MSTALLEDPRSPVLSSARLLTAADLVRLPTESAAGTVRYELDDGRLVTTAPPGEIHGAAESVLVGELFNQGQRAGYGRVRSGDVGILLRRSPDRVVGADVVFISTASLASRRSPEGYLLTLPELLVEIVSKNDTSTEVAAKVQGLLASVGARRLGC
jgi:Uma2 family endonuclease